MGDPNLNGQIVGAMLCGMLCGLMFGLLICVGVLWLACALCGVEKPTLIGGIGIVLVVGITTGLAQGGITAAALGYVENTGGGAERLQSANSAACVFGLSVNAIISAAWYSVFLNTTFGKGLLVWIVQLVLVLVFVVGILLLALAANPNLLKNQPKFMPIPARIG